jgi:hypothetical protein
MKKFDFPSYNVAVAHGARLINARGERFMQQYDPERLERSELSHVVAAFAKEIVDGRGPVYVDLRHVDESYWTDIAKLHRGGSILLTDHVPDPKTNPLPIEPTWGLWASGRSGLQIDLGAPIFMGCWRPARWPRTMPPGRTPARARRPRSARSPAGTPAKRPRSRAASVSIR